MRSLIGFLLMVGVLGCLHAAADTVPCSPRTHGPSAEVEDFQAPAMEEIYRLRIVNDENGAVMGLHTGSTRWDMLGHVVRYTTQVSHEGYTASKWAPMGAVAATAVNAIHIRTGYNTAKDKGIVFSILPQELQTASGTKLQSYLSPDSSIYTDMPGGTGIFGGHWSPILGNKVYLDCAGCLTPMAEGYVPQRGDVLVIPVMRPIYTPESIIFENRFGGFITLVNFDNTTQVIGQVLRPVAGVGRFTGTQYADVGRLRANHNGVIDISVSRFGQIGGFQIIPREHAMSPEMTRARTMSQWMVVGPLDARNPSWEGVAPLFLNYLAPSWREDDWDYTDWLCRVLSRVIIDVRVKDGPWQPMPEFHFDQDLDKPLPEWSASALEHVTHIRIHLPVPSKLPQRACPSADTTPCCLSQQ